MYVEYVKAVQVDICVLSKKRSVWEFFEWIYFLAVYPEMWTINVIKCLKHFWLVRIFFFLKINFHSMTFSLNAEDA